VIKKRGDRWRVVVYAGRDPLTGRKRQKTGTAATKAEARQLEARPVGEVGAGQHGSKCQHCYRRIRKGQPPMRPGEVFHLAFTVLPSPARHRRRRRPACLGCTAVAFGV
jgi:hypothetical protein